MNFITTYCHLNLNYCAVNGHVIARRNENSEDGWFKQLYKEQELVYPKFYKMDLLSQAGFLASEMIKRANPAIVSTYNDDEIAMVFANQHSSAHTDARFVNSYVNNGAPSPSLFVYTLPNIVLGEIAIINKWHGENMFAVLAKFAPDFFLNYTQALLHSGSAAALCGWLGIEGEDVNVFLFLIEKENSDGLDANADNLMKIAGF